MGYGDGSVFQNDRGGWTMFATIDGKRYKRTGPTKTATKAKIAELRRQLTLGESSVATRLTVAAVINDWLERDLAGRNRAPQTLEAHRWAADRIKAAVGKKPAAKLTVRSVDDMLDQFAAEGLSRASLIKIRSTLSQSLRFAVRREDLSRNVAEHATIPAAATRTAERLSLSPTEARTLLDTLKTERNGLMFALSLRLGLRPGEASGLYWEDIGDDAVNVTRGVRRTGGRAEVAVTDELKTKSSKRTVGMPTDLVGWFTEHRRAQTIERLAATSWTHDRLVFASVTGNILSPSNNRKQLAGICKRAEVPAVTPNELRHSCASLFSDEGVPNELIADLLGHTTTRMVDETYRHPLRPVVSVASNAKWAEIE